ncbi:MAG TPA: type IX secretion system membrane protein PorP/SprF, partial [Crocinitomix sp.]|nr:type IX secretion system membrane protein PorP/SprF [Crocinitomix sp.]
RSHYTGYIKRFDLIFGGYYRFLYESLIPTLQMNFNSFTFGISYDVNISGLAMASRNRGGIEFMLKYAPLPKPNSSNFPRF